MVTESQSAAGPASAPGESTEVAATESVKPGLPIATRKEILKFINEVDLVDANSLVDKFGYTWRGAYTKLQRLRKDGLVERFLKPGEYAITEAGLRRITDDKAKG